MVSDDVDVYIKYKPSTTNQKMGNLELAGISSVKKVSNGCCANDAKLVYGEPFRFEGNLSQQEDVMRTWTK